MELFIRKTVAVILCGCTVTSPAQAVLNDGPPNNGSSFDWVIVGGGTAGLVLANRLSSDLKTTVAVVEAGAAQLNNPNVTLLGKFSPGLHTQIDWQYPSSPQNFAEGQTFVYDAGKGLGGTSLINGMTYIRAAIPQIDAWEKSFGNEGWNWANLWPYYLKSETFQAPDVAQIQEGADYIPNAHSEQGAVEVGWFAGIAGPDTYHKIRSAWEAIGTEWISDPNAGNSTGASLWPLTISRSENIRWDSARAYLFDERNNITARANLHVFQNTVAQRITWGDDVNGTAQAAGVIVTGGSEDEVAVMATREVILSAGSLKSPVILEESGVGNADVLGAQNVSVKLDLPSVGENLQDQPQIGIEDIAGPGKFFTGYPTYVTFATANDLFGDNVTNVEKYVRSQIPAYAQTITSQAVTGATSPTVQEKLLNDQADLIFKDLIPIAEVLTAPFHNIVSMPFWNLLPFSRGSVHINRSSSDGVPIIDPKFFLADWDGIALAAIGRLTRKFLTAGRAAGWVGSEIVPGAGNVTTDDTDAEWITYAKKYFSLNYHPVGTTAMMAQDLGGVVDCNLKVYGTNNVRVVDAGIFPAQIDGHLTSTIYAVAERAADIILGKI